MIANIYTASYSSIKNDKFNDRLVSISGDRGKKANYIGECFPSLAPKKDFWFNWHSRTNPYSIENIEYYITEYYRQVLSTLNIDDVVEKLRNKILLCYEPNDEFCHRDIFAYWIELVLGKEIPEIRVSSDGKVIKLPRPGYVREILERVMKKELNIDDNHSIQAYFLNKKAEELDSYAIKAMDDDDSNYSMQLSLLAKEYRASAASVDDEYARNNKKFKKAI